MADLFVAMTCPVCQHAATGAMPTDRCVVFYECDTCTPSCARNPATPTRLRSSAISPPESRRRSQNRPHLHMRAMDFTGSPMRGFVHVAPPGFRTAAALRVWLSHGERVARQKPPTRTRRRSLPRKTAAHMRKRAAKCSEMTAGATPAGGSSAASARPRDEWALFSAVTRRCYSAPPSRATDAWMHLPSPENRGTR
jgi:hypothetical protein